MPAKQERKGEVLGPVYGVFSVAALGARRSQNVQWMEAHPDASPWRLVLDGFANHAVASPSAHWQSLRDCIEGIRPSSSPR
jgi:hypothetical protein